uniref:Cytochrome P450 n=1 Tax=Steinernema glaseri TaxID=37863 RepID=A0A1I8A5T6_9BILA
MELIPLKLTKSQMPSTWTKATRNGCNTITVVIRVLRFVDLLGDSNRWSNTKKERRRAWGKGVAMRTGAGDQDICHPLSFIGMDPKEGKTYCSLKRQSATRTIGNGRIFGELYVTARRAAQGEPEAAGDANEATRDLKGPECMMESHLAEGNRIYHAIDHEESAFWRISDREQFFWDRSVFASELLDHPPSHFPSMFRLGPIIWMIACDVSWAPKWIILHRKHRKHKRGRAQMTESTYPCRRNDYEVLVFLRENGMTRWVTMSISQWLYETSCTKEAMEQCHCILPRRVDKAAFLE